MKSPGKVFLIDTNVILRYLLDDHKHFSPKAKSLMKGVCDGVIQAEIMAVVLSECVWVLEKFYKVSKAEIADKLSAIMNFKGMANSDKSQILMALLNCKETGIDIVDCLLAAHSSPERPVVSFDNDFKKLKAFQGPPITS